MSMQTSSPVHVSDLGRIRWRVDSARSRVEFHCRTLWGLVTVKGRFERYDGTLHLSGPTAIELTVEAQSLDTNNAKSDTHLRSPHFFDVEKHPQVRFSSDAAELEGERLHLHGHLHASGESVPLALDATLRRVGSELEVEAVTAADHRQLGMTWNKLGMLRGPSELIVIGRLVQDGQRPARREPARP